ncbi:MULTISPECIES: lipopolysaccharide assembly protein LapA domain-containing protein [unclassified Synechocystis]|uniref:lipopolysaccharide assembly protein LapA domain-containing protein n=1 Tax=unclassified Synechocystis TaxID=2640012 RepID=UPI0004D0B7D6|nr:MULTISPECIES: LapA family protein [unclassified Synechocystis]AIE73749.1 hypothetical protein D082_12210 [Synechocystis sp. PCC 6714]MCT0252422.1 LapA family protein [Synechocystis sp. CS-94]
MQGLLLIFLIATGLIFFLQNRQPIQLNFFGTTAESALASFTLPLGLWVVLFLTLGVVASVLINGLSSLGQPKARTQNFRSNPPRRSPPESFGPPPATPPSPQQPPEPATMKEEWDWDEPEPDLADWNDAKPPARSQPKLQNSPRQTVRNVRPFSPEPPEPPEAKESVTPGDNESNDFSPTPVSPEKIAPPPPREPLPDLRQFEVPQTPRNTTQQGSIYSQQYRPARSSGVKASKNEESASNAPPTGNVYDAPYRVIDSAPNSSVSQEDNTVDEEEDWI